MHFILHLVLLAVIIHSEDLCSQSEYDEYLDLYPIKYGNNREEYKQCAILDCFIRRKHYKYFKGNCEYMHIRKYYVPYDMEYTMLTDFNPDDLRGMNRSIREEDPIMRESILSLVRLNPPTPPFIATSVPLPIRSSLSTLPLPDAPCPGSR